MEKKEYRLTLGNDELVCEFSDLAEQANGSVMVKYGNTVILATAVMSQEPRDNHFFPLTVDYEERFYAAGQILGSRFMRREGRPSDEAILTGRIVDRTIRPLFDQHIRNDIQVVITVLSLGTYDPDTLSVIGASLALSTSDIPWNGPVSAVRVIKKDEKSDFSINPSLTERSEQEEVKPLVDLIACGKGGTINMIECGGYEADESLVGDSLDRAHEELEKIGVFQQKIIAERGKKKRELVYEEAPKEALASLFEEHIGETRLHEALFSGPGKKYISALENEWISLLSETHPEIKKSHALEYIEEKINDLLHKEAIENGRRPDGRSVNEVRPLFAQAGNISPLLHGSGIFYRGGTHILSVLTLGGPGDSLIIDGMEMQTKKRFIHHYNFPPFSTGETGRIGGTNRRMVGHGALAEKALLPVIPSKENFPYTIRLVSEAFASNGSTSMGSVCGSSLALMDAGVPITNAVAGIASGLMFEQNDRYQLLTDIQGPEDHHGDMDFKVAGTRKGITAIQMDVKVNGIPIPILKEALLRAKEARETILERMDQEIKTPRTDISPYAPKILATKIKVSQIGMVIGPGGKNINEIREKTETEIDIEDDGTVFITGKGEGPLRAKQIIEEMTHEYRPGEKIVGTITRITDFGAFAKFGADTEGLIHISEIAPFRINAVKEVLSEGETVSAVIKEIDERGRIRLSIKDLDPEFATKKGIAPPKK